MTNDEEFYAWLDGELDGEAAERMAAQVAADPELQRRAMEHRALRDRLRAAFDQVAAAPVPDALLAAASPRGDIVDLAEARARRQRPFFTPIWKQAAAMAATLAVGVMAGNLFSTPPSGPVAQQGGHLLAAGQLQEALQTQLASAPSEDGPRIALTFRDHSGTICRSFNDQGVSGLACRAGGEWRIRGLFEPTEGQQGDYRMASGSDPQLAALIEQEMTGEPLDAQQEKRAKDNDWR